VAVILDFCSRFAVGWAMSERITDDLTLNALGMAMARRQPAAPFGSWELGELGEANWGSVRREESGIALTADTLWWQHRVHLSALLVKHQIPTVYDLRVFAQNGF
jgi:transposase InsO family protein